MPPTERSRGFRDDGVEALGMGLDDRDYVRNDPRSAARWSPSSGQQVTRTLIVVTIAVFLAQLITKRPGRAGLVTDWLVLDFAALGQGQVWRLITYAFCHSTRNPLHIAFNMLVLWWAGGAVESLYGGREFLRFYFVAAVASAAAYIVLGSVMGRIFPMLGASGCTMACFAVFASHYPRAQVRLMGILPVEARWLLVGFVVLDMAPVIRELLGGGHVGNVAHAAHLGGLAFGLWYKWSGTRIANWFGFLGGLDKLTKRGPRSNPNVRIYDPEGEPASSEPRGELTREELEARVDALLDKIREQGEASLTDEERTFLKEASKRYR